MKPAQLALILIAGSLASNAQNISSTASVSRMIRVEGNVSAPLSEVWRVFTTSSGAQEFFAQKANIGLAIGGPYEIQFDPKDERSGTKGLTILSYAPQEMISFQWNAPPEFPEVRNGGTWVVVEMHPVDAYTTHVNISHLGWKNGGEWDLAYAHFQQGWSELMTRLEQRFIDGPIDWNQQAMMYQRSKARPR